MKDGHRTTFLTSLEFFGVKAVGQKPKRNAALELEKIHTRLIFQKFFLCYFILFGL